MLKASAPAGLRSSSLKTKGYWLLHLPCFVSIPTPQGAALLSLLAFLHFTVLVFSKSLLTAHFFCPGNLSLGSTSGAFKEMEFGEGFQAVGFSTSWRPILSAKQALYLVFSCPPLPRAQKLGSKCAPFPTSPPPEAGPTEQPTPPSSSQAKIL